MHGASKLYNLLTLGVCVLVCVRAIVLLVSFLICIFQFSSRTLWGRTVRILRVQSPGEESYIVNMRTLLNPIQKVEPHLLLTALKALQGNV